MDILAEIPHYGFWFVVVLTVLVFVHEMGHFLVARLCGVRVEKFSIGFGPELIGFTDRHGTRWMMSWLPFGGYVKMFGQEDNAIEGKPIGERQPHVRPDAPEMISIYQEVRHSIEDAMNKGLRMATGEVIAFVNAGDMIAHRSCVSEMAAEFAKGDADAIYGDAYMVDPHDIRKVKRFWKGGTYDRKKFRSGWMPPHLGTYIRKDVYDRFGLFRGDLKVSADYELMFRFMFKHRIRVHYVPKVLVRFRLGGVSNRSLAHIWRANLEVYKAWGLNGEHVSPLIILAKPLRKVAQILRRVD